MLLPTPVLPQDAPAIPSECPVTSLKSDSVLDAGDAAGARSGRASQEHVSLAFASLDGPPSVYDELESLKESIHRVEVQCGRREQDVARFASDAYQPPDLLVLSLSLSLSRARARARALSLSLACARSLLSVRVRAYSLSRRCCDHIQHIGEFTQTRLT
jgi:hypothetical protein